MFTHIYIVELLTSGVLNYTSTA